MTRAGALRIGAVARATGIPADTLRAWERRYGRIASRRSPSGYRLFTDADVRRLRRLRSLVDAGHAIGELASLTDHELAQLEARTGGAPTMASDAAAATRARFLVAIEALDTDVARVALATARVVLAAGAFVREVTIPLLRELGERWARGTLGIAHEHAASAVIRGELGELLRAHAARSGAPLVVCATPTGELHELGALSAAVIAAEARLRVVYLGPNVPANEIARAAVEARASAVLLSCIALTDRDGEAIRDVRGALPHDIALVVGGARSSIAPGVERLESLDEIPAALARILTSSPR